MLILRLRFKNQGLPSNCILSIEFSRHSSKPSDVWNGDFCRYIGKQSPFTGFLLLAFHPSVWSVLKLDVLCYRNQRRSKDSPNAFPWGHLAWEFAREKAPLNTVWLYVFRDEQAVNSIQRFSLGKTSLPHSLLFLKHTLPHFQLRAVQLHHGVIFPERIPMPTNSYDMNWWVNFFYHWSTGNLAQKCVNA